MTIEQILTAIVAWHALSFVRSTVRDALDRRHAKDPAAMARELFAQYREFMDDAASRSELERLAELERWDRSNPAPVTGAMKQAMRRETLGGLSDAQEARARRCDGLDGIDSRGCEQARGHVGICTPFRDEG
jgi:hypothetical protein